MNYLYHIVRKDLFGKTLYPLSQLKEVNPSLYEEHSSKYKNRKHITKLYIPQLNCYWNDVIHLTAVHPNIIVQKLKAAGDTKQHTYNYFQIDPFALDPTKAVVYPNIPKENPNHLTKKDFTRFNPAEIEQWSVFPKETFTHYKYRISQDQEALLFLYIPHILYKGSIDVSSLQLLQTQI